MSVTRNLLENGISIFVKGKALKNCITKRDEYFLKKCLISWKYDTRK